MNSYVNCHFTSITLIGGGSLMEWYADFLREKYSLNICVVLAPRHVATVNKESLIANGVRVLITDDINQDDAAKNILSHFSDLCICFGPAWIFNLDILELFNYAILNFNGIPIPRYLGGAHHSWQILNRNYEGGCFYQLITETVDRGPVIHHEKFSYSFDCKIPSDYERENDNYHKSSLLKFADYFMREGIQNNRLLNPVEVDWNEICYFPRLHTALNGWIDWNWEGSDIEVFCNAFDSPYPGARTYYKGCVITLKSVKLITSEVYHPYCSGLITNILKSETLTLHIATNSGLLSVSSIDFLDHSHQTPNFKLGARLHTPSNVLADSIKEVRYSHQGLLTD